MEMTAATAKRTRRAHPETCLTATCPEPMIRCDVSSRNGSVELLSREGEIAIAKRIEAGREMMIGGICESPLTIRALLHWRDQIADGVVLRDIIDLEATYAKINGGAVDEEMINRMRMESRIPIFRMMTRK